MNFGIRVAIVFSFLIRHFVSSCSTKVYPDDKMMVDSPYINIFNALRNEGSFRFVDSIGRQKEFVVTKIDSFCLNSKGWFINGKPFTQMVLHFKEIGSDTTVLRRYIELTVGKDPVSDSSGIVVQFNNFYFDGAITSGIILDTVIEKVQMKNVYLLKPSFNDKFQGANDVKELFVSAEKGFTAFKTVDGGFWHRK